MVYLEITKPNNFRGCPASVQDHIFNGDAAMNCLPSIKTCSKCQVSKPVSEFYKKPNGSYHCWCYSCSAEYACERRVTHKDHLKAQKVIRYDLNRDEINKKAQQHRKDNLEECRKKDRERNKKHRKRNNTWAKEYREKNKAILAEKRKIRYIENLELFKERGRKQYQLHKEDNKERQREYNKTHKKEIAERDKKYRAENKEPIGKRQKKYRAENKETIDKAQREYRADNRKELSEYQKKYRKTEKGKAALKKGGQKHRALKRGATVEDFSSIEVFKRDAYICQSCKKKTRPDYKPTHPLYPHLDHIQPLSLGGNHSRKNTQCLCSHCNLTKNNSGKGDQLRLFG